MDSPKADRAWYERQPRSWRTAISEGVDAGMHFASRLAILAGIMLAIAGFRTGAWLPILKMWVAYVILCAGLSAAIGVMYGSLKPMGRTLPGRVALAFVVMYGLFGPATYLGVRLFGEGVSMARAQLVVAAICLALSPIGLLDRQS